MPREAMKLLTVAVFSTVLMGAALAEESVKAKHGAWDLRCQSPDGKSPAQCGLTQTVRSEDKANVNLGVIVLKQAGAKTGVLRVVAPLSVYLINGVSLKIDQTDIGRVPFFRCAADGCVADAPLDDKLLEQMKSGKLATLVIYLDPYEGLRHQLKLDGFGEAYGKLQ